MFYVGMFQSYTTQYIPLPVRGVYDSFNQSGDAQQCLSMRSILSLIIVICSQIERTHICIVYLLHRGISHKLSTPLTKHHGCSRACPGFLHLLPSISG